MSYASLQYSIICALCLLSTTANQSNFNLFPILPPPPLPSIDLRPIINSVALHLHSFPGSFLFCCVLPHLEAFLPFPTPSSKPASLTSSQKSPLLFTKFSGLSNSLTLPPSSTRILSLSKIVFIRCAIVIIVRLENWGERSVCCKRASVSMSTAAVASSSTKMLVGVRRARDREISWRWPEDRFEPVRGLDFGFRI